MCLVESDCKLPTADCKLSIQFILYVLKFVCDLF